MSMPQPFILNPQNQPFVDGRAPRPAAVTANKSIALPVVGLFWASIGGLCCGWYAMMGFVGMVMDVLGPDPGLVAQGAALMLLVLYSVVLGGSILWLIFLIVSRMNLRESLMQQGRLIHGTVVWCKGKVHFSEGQSSDYYHVTVTYEFQSPTGQSLWNRGVEVRDDLRGQPLPKPGTPVLVLYLDDQNYALI